MKHIIKDMSSIGKMNKIRYICLFLLVLCYPRISQAGRIEQYVDSSTTWLSDRLQMHWVTYADTTYIKGEVYDHLGQHRAPVPTVCLSGTRGHATTYRHPSLEEIPPRHEDERGMWLYDNATQQYKWAPISETGNIAQSINQEICSLALQAAKKGTQPYLDIANSILKTYMYGIRYTQMPQDILHGHMQTLVGLQSFEVIHENTLPYMTETYNLLLQSPDASRLFPDAGRDTCIENAFRHWAEIIIANGVPHNNWDIIQARFILNVASALQDDSAYADGRGKQYYIDVVLHQDFVRQWSLSRLAQQGFDQNNGIWHECAGYNLVVLEEFDKARALLLDLTGNDLYDELPILIKARQTAAQMLFPDSLTIGFGDTHPSRLESYSLFRNSTKSGNTPAEALRSTLFYAPESSWLVARTGMEKDTDLAFALNGSKGNHQHANGISLELYGCGLRLGPDAGIGYTLYSGSDYLEYYGRFPAHNTVCVDGVSDYPIMMSQHAFTLLDSASTTLNSKLSTLHSPLSYAEVEFIEPETQAMQRRLVVMTEQYFVDIFRSRRQDGQDRFNDYFYHNLGQRILSQGANLQGTPSSDLAFAGGHLYAYSYFYDVQQIPYTTNLTYSINNDSICMNQWSKPADHRRFYRALAPSTEGLSRIKGMPYDIRNTPTLTYIERQFGEAWTRPFVHVFEPTAKHQTPSTIQRVEYPKVTIIDKTTESAVAVLIVHKDGTRDLIVSTDNPQSCVRVLGKKYKGAINCVRL